MEAFGLQAMRSAFVNNTASVLHNELPFLTYRTAAAMKAQLETISRLPGTVYRLRGGLASAAPEPCSSGRRSMFDCGHTIKGAAGSVGANALALVAWKM